MEQIGKATHITEDLCQAIVQECQRRVAGAVENQLPLIQSGARQQAIENLIFFLPPADFLLALETLANQIGSLFATGDHAVQKEYLAFLVELVFALRSLLPRWNLQNHERYGKAALTQARLEASADFLQSLLQRLASEAPLAEAELLTGYRRQAEARYKAEQAADPQEAAKALVGGSLSEYVLNYCREIAGSQLRRIAEMRFSGEDVTELSNDYAAFLQHALYLGASFVTTNPPLLNMAWDALPELWNPLIDRLILANPQADIEHLTRLATLEFVLAQMRLLRPIFLLETGRMGSVCLQVNPEKHGDAQAMVSDALFFYEQMRARLDGGVPNVVFKLPGTLAGLQACRELTGRGIGVTITVNFGMFQHIPFAEAIHAGKAIYSNLVEMNGRLAFPVRDELLSKLDELASWGIDETQARQAAAWAGVVVAKKLYQALKQRGIDQRRAKILIASLRIYSGEAYRDLPNAFPDITEITGARLLSVFPNVRRAFDQSAPISIQPRQIEAAVPPRILDILAHSEIFRQAYYLPGDDERFRPHKPLSLEDEEGTFNWAPVYNTLTEFIKSYQTTARRIAERRVQLLDLSER